MYSYEEANSVLKQTNLKSSDMRFDEFVLPIKYNRDTFCVNVSVCYISLPYLCEVNCSNQEYKCNNWTQGKN